MRGLDDPGQRLGPSQLLVAFHDQDGSRLWTQKPEIQSWRSVTQQHVGVVSVRVDG